MFDVSVIKFFIAHYNYCILSHDKHEWLRLRDMQLLGGNSYTALWSSNVKVQLFFLNMIDLSVHRSVFYVLSAANGAVQNSWTRNKDKSVLKRRVRSGSKGGPGAKREGGSWHVANGELHFTVVGFLKQKIHLVSINRTIINRMCLKT